MNFPKPLERFDLAVVGAGIVGLGVALAAVQRGLRVVVIDRDAQPHPYVRIATVTSGAGASTGFAIGEEVITSLLEGGAAQ